MACPVCLKDHPPGTAHVFAYINKIVTRPGCLQCDARDRVIDELCKRIEELQRVMPTPAKEIAPKPKYDHSAHMKQVWEKRRAGV